MDKNEMRDFTMTEIIGTALIAMRQESSETMSHP